MPLVITLRKGEDFYIGDQQFVLSDIKSEHHVQVSSKGKTFDVTDAEGNEIANDVIASLGDRNTLAVVRISLAAPRSIAIATGENYRKAGGKALHRAR